jgi:hypothetical protein
MLHVVAPLATAGSGWRALLRNIFLDIGAGTATRHRLYAHAGHWYAGVGFGVRREFQTDRLGCGRFVSPLPLPIVRMPGVEDGCWFCAIRAVGAVGIWYVYVGGG